ncbi:MAG: YgjV family protein [Ruminococcaceae bacterium]|nr:YgjV family protein [Oscillospiraceae bacterium]
MNLIAQLFGLGAMTALFLIYQQKNRRHMILAKLTADICWVVHYLCLGGFAGMIPNAVGIFRELVFINRKDKKWASHAIWPMVFIFINWALGIRTFNSWYNILPITASTFVTVSLWIDNPRLTKIISIPISSAFLIYDIFVGSYIGIVNEAVSIISIILYFIKEHGGRNEK